MKIYCGLRDGEDCFVRVSAAPAGAAGGEPYLLPGRPDLFRDWLPDLCLGSAAEPPPSFRWAERSTGTDHLALAIAVDVAGGAGSAEEAAALLAGLPFLRRFLARLPPDGFEIAGTIFMAMLKAAAEPPPAAPRGRRQLEAVGS